MVDTLVLGTSGVICGGSSPSTRTIFYLFMLYIIKYFKRSQTIINFKKFINKCLLSNNEEKSHSIIFSFMKNIVLLPIKFMKTILFVSDSSLQNNGIAEYNIYRQYAKYKFIVFLAVVFLVVLLVNKKDIKKTDYIARISIIGGIDDGEYGYGGIKFYEEVIKKAIDDKNVKAVIVYVNSGGGQVTSSEVLYQNLLKLSTKKPTMCDVATVSASGAYMASLACKKIYAKKTSIIGSIGVRNDLYEIGELADKIGIKLNLMTAGNVKAAGHPWKKMSSEEYQYLNNLLNKIHLFFINLVAQERSLSFEDAKKLSDGSIFLGEEAKKLGLIDEIGDSDIVVTDLIRDYNLDKNIKIIDFENPQPDQSFYSKMKNFTGLAVNSLFEAFNSKVSKSEFKMVL